MSKIAVIGAGMVGATTAYTLAISGLADELVLIDINKERALGEALDIRHGLPLCSPVKLESGGYELLEGSQLVIMTAGASQRQGETRLELADRNIKVMEQVSKEVASRAPDSVLLVVTNPVDALTYTAIKATGFESNRVLGSGTVLDSSRFKALLSRHTGVDARNVHAYVLGEHGDSELAAWSTVSIAGMSAGEFCRICGGCQHSLSERLNSEFDAEVRRAAYTVIEKKGATYYAVALAVRRIAQAILRDEHSILTVSTLLNGEYGLRDLCLSIPCVVGRRGIVRTLPVKLSEQEEALMRNSADVVSGVIHRTSDEKSKV